MFDHDALADSLANDEIVNINGMSLLDLLVYALTSEHLAAYQYWTSYQSSRGKGKSDCDPEFKQHYEEETDHAEKLMDRVNELGGIPVYDPTYWTKIYPKFVPISGPSVKEQLITNINAEKDAIALYKQIIAASGNNVDPTTHRLAKSILADEEKHLYELERLLEDCFAD